MGISDWLPSSGLRILLILVVSLIAYLIAKSMMRPLIKGYILRHGKGRHSDSWFQQRVDTVNRLSSALATILIIFVATWMVFSEVGLDITPLLASAGVAGIAIGYSTQAIIKDFLNGIFIVTEDQFCVGDIIKVGETGGEVESLSLRRTVLRTLDGVVHSIPNGSIGIVSNYTRDYARVKMDIPVPYETDLDRAIEIINMVGLELAGDDKFKKHVKKAPQVLWVENLSRGRIDIRVLGETYPKRHWKVASELRQRIKKAFEQEGIKIPIPHTKLYFSERQLGKYFSD